MLAEPGVARFLQPHIVIGRHGVDFDDRMAIGQQPPRQMEADEAGAAGDEDLHVRRRSAWGFAGPS